MTCPLGSAVKYRPGRSISERWPLPASNRCAFGLLISSVTLLTRLPDPDDRTLAARHAAAHPQLVVLGVHGHHPQVFDRRALVAHLPRHPLPREDPRRGRRSAHGAGRPHVVRAVGNRTASEAVALDGPLEALALRGGGHVDLVPDLEHVGPDGAADLARYVA